METREKIIDEALELFSKQGYEGVSVAQIGNAVGIKAPSLYKHFKNKQAIFDEIVHVMKERYDMQAAGMGLNGSDEKNDSAMFTAIPEEQLEKMVVNLFLFFLHDGYAVKFRKMMTLEQFRNKELSELYSEQYYDGPIGYQSGIFQILQKTGSLKNVSPQILALEFYAPVYMLLTVCDRQPEREKESIELLENHVREFERRYRNHRGDEK